MQNAPAAAFGVSSQVSVLAQVLAGSANTDGCRIVLALVLAVLLIQVLILELAHPPTLVLALVLVSS